VDKSVGVSGWKSNALFLAVFAPVAKLAKVIFRQRIHPIATEPAPAENLFFASAGRHLNVTQTKPSGHEIATRACDIAPD